MSTCKKKLNARQYYVLAKVEKVPAKVVTDVGPQESRLDGEILFLMEKTDKDIKLYL